MAKKKKGPLKRYQGFSERKQDRILRYAGADEDEFETYKPKRQRRIVRRGIAENQRRLQPIAGPGTLTEHQARRQVRSEAQLGFGPTERAYEQREQAIPAWFENYRQQVGQAQQGFQQYAAPLQQQAQAQVQQSGQVAPGVDPNTEAGGDAQLAAQARQALTGLGLTTLNSIVTANQGYFAGRQDVASTAELGEQRQLASEREGTKKEKGAFKRARLGEIRGEEHTRGLERAAFGLESYEAETERQQKRREARTEAREAADEFKAEHGVSRKQWRRMTPEQRRAWKRRWEASPKTSSDRINDAKLEYFRQHGRFPGTGAGGGGGGLSPSERRQRRSEREKEREGRREAIGRVEDLRTVWDEYARKRNKDETTGKTIKPTPDQIKAQLRKDGYKPGEIHLMLMVRAGKRLTPADIRLAKRLGAWPIPKRWRGKKPYEGGAGHGGAPGPAGQGSRPT